MTDHRDQLKRVVRRQAEELDVERLARALEAVARHDGPVRDVSFAEFARIVAAEYRRLADKA